MLSSISARQTAGSWLEDTSPIPIHVGTNARLFVLLGHAFGTTPEFWLNLQSRYQLDLANTRVPRDAIRRADAFNRELLAA
jgi:hypothetical protein